MVSPATVFIVDDDAAVRTALTRSLDHCGYAVAAYESAEAFLTAYQADWQGCLLLDVRMPGMSGIELQQALQAQQCTIPIIFITGHGDVPMSVQAIKRGAVEFLEKPFRLAVLLERIDEALA